MPEIAIPRPLPHQRDIDASPVRFKVARWGRRRGKSTWAFKAAIVGHGPGEASNPLFKGVMHGKHVFWIAPDYPQASLIWHTEVEPRFRDIPGVKVNNSDFEVWFPNGGALLIRSAENIGAVRGSGKLLAGVVLEEAAHWNLEDGWLNEILPPLTDNDGWAIFISTTNGGNDGKVDEADNKVIPSYFNRLCTAIQQGLKGPLWREWYGTALENPKIGPTRFQALVDEYPAGSIALKQEVYAELVEGGAGRAFTEWNKDVHVVNWPSIPPNWSWGAALDFGYRAPGSLGIFACSPEDERTIVLWDEFYFREMSAFEAGRQSAKKLQATTVFAVAADSAMWAKTGVGETVAEQFQAGLDSVYGGPGQGPRLYEVTKGPGSRAAGKQLVHRCLKWGPALPDGSVPEWLQPILRIHSRCTNALRTIPALPIKAGHPEDVDTDAEDHSFDMVRYFLASRPIKGQAWRDRDEPDTHPGFDYTERKRKVSKYEAAFRQQFDPEPGMEVLSD